MNADRPKLTAADRAADGTGPANLPAQEESAADMAISQQARADVVKASDMSTEAKNVNINTQGGVVTLQGPVASSREKITSRRSLRRSTGSSASTIA
jgi:hypothetical protein